MFSSGSTGSNNIQMHAWLYLACGLLFSAYLLLWVRLRRARALLAHLPCLPQLPLVGNLLQVAGDGRSLFRLLEHVSREADEARKPFVVWLGSVPNIVIIDPDDVKLVTNTFLEKPYYYSFGKEWLGDGLVTAPVCEWKKNVKSLAHTFNTSVVEGYQMIFSAQAHKLVRTLKNEVGKKPMDFMHLVAYTTLETICQTAFGSARISESIVTQEYHVAFSRCLELIVRRGLSPWLHPDWLYRLTNDYKKFRRYVAVMQNVSHMVLENKKKEREELKKKGTAGIAGDTDKKFKAVLDILLDLKESNPQLTEKYIKHEVDTIIVGGQETTGSTLFYALLMIGARPEVQEKLHKEMESIFGGTSRPVQKTDLQRMPYCEAVVHETLRLFPPLPTVMRYADHELQLKSCRVPKGAGCAINAWGAGRSKRTWGPDALEFDPERWLDNRAPINPASFLPFSYGKRACIGKKYAMAILKTILACCVRELQFSSEADKMEFKMDIALRPVSGHLMQVELRK